MQRTLIQSATIISMDDCIGDLRAGDVLVENGRIAEVRPGIELGSGAAQAEIVDGRGRIVIPGLINAHMHTWQTALRGYAANWTLLEYFRRVLGEGHDHGFPAAAGLTQRRLVAKNPSA